MFFVGGNECGAGGGDLLEMLEDSGIVLGDLFAGRGGGLESAKSGFLLAAEFGDLGEFRLCGGLLFAKAGESGNGLGDFLLGAGVVGDRLIEAGGGFRGELVLASSGLEPALGFPVPVKSAS